MVSEKDQFNGIEKIGWGESHGFLAKMRLAAKVLPCASGTEHEELLINCFENPSGAPPRRTEFKYGEVPREWPTTTEELVEELESRKEMSERRIEEMKRAKNRPSKTRVDYSPEEKKIADQMLDQPEFAEVKARLQRRLEQIGQIKAFYDPDKLAEAEQELSQTEGVLKFINKLVEEGKI